MSTIREALQAGAREQAEWSEQQRPGHTGAVRWPADGAKYPLTLAEVCWRLTELERRLAAVERYHPSPARERPGDAVWRQATEP